MMTPAWTTSKSYIERVDPVNITVDDKEKASDGFPLPLCPITAKK
jgi:hypothetical protein